jgi:Icc-related predicted phosphoesterase
MFRIVCISDLQGQCEKIKHSDLPDGDLLLIAGDLTNVGKLPELIIFNNWLSTLKSKYGSMICIAGNHDLGLNRGLNGHSIFTEATYLENELVEVGGLKIFGTPANSCGPYAQYWEFCDPKYTRRVYKNMPKCDIIISHGCPYGILDETPRGEHIGDKDLLNSIQRIRPRLVIFGHNHAGYGTYEKDGTTFVNAALCDDNNTLVDTKWNLIRSPIVIDL